jgi:hypothetical protein
VIGLFPPDGAAPKVLKLKHELFHGQDMSFSPDGQHLFAEAGKEFTLVDVMTGVARTVDSHSDAIRHAAWNHDGTRLATASKDVCRLQSRRTATGVPE